MVEAVITTMHMEMDELKDVLVASRACEAKGDLLLTIFLSWTSQGLWSSRAHRVPKDMNNFL